MYYPYSVPLLLYINLRTTAFFLLSLSYQIFLRGAADPAAVVLDSLCLSINIDKRILVIN
jgi:hypothetical protein